MSMSKETFKTFRDFIKINGLVKKHGPKIGCPKKEYYKYTVQRSLCRSTKYSPTSKLWSGKIQHKMDEYCFQLLYMRAKRVVLVLLSSRADTTSLVRTTTLRMHIINYVQCVYFFSLYINHKMYVENGMFGEFK